ncbi:hypothetical protein MMC18_009270 [Xylographa bjoerkii]|nr:hypothetical protein [Xylographa bjoerkii]
MGTPPQSFALGIDTGSSDFVVMTPNTAPCAAGNCTYGTFDPTKSTSYVSQNSSFATKYTNTFVNGTLASETLSLGGITLTNFTVAVGSVSNDAANVFGIGYLPDEATLPYTYPNGPYAMKNAGLIEVAAYSLWLNDINSQAGSILFGGVDSAKYTGSLQTVPVVPMVASSASPNPAQSNYVKLQVTLDAIGTSKGSTSTLTTSSGFPITVLLDSGSTTCYLPPQIITNICLAFGGCGGQAPQYTLPCSLNAPNSGNISFNFSGQNITVPISEFIQNGNQGPSGQMCTFLMVPKNDTYILGDSFLRSAYVVFNLDANEIALAQTVFNVSTSNILEITNGSSTANGATYYTNFGIANAANASNIRTGIPSGTGSFQPAITNGASTRKSFGAATLVAAGLGLVALCGGA